MGPRRRDGGGILAEMGKRKDLIRECHEGIPMVTTQAVLDEERHIVAFALKGKGRWRPLGKTGVKLPEP